MDYLSPLRSELKLSIILSLLEGEKKLAELKEQVKTRETSILHVLKEFESLNLSTKTAGTYSLTSLGKIEAQICKNAQSTTETMEKFKDFWLLHDIEPIPPHLLLKIGALKDSTLIRAASTELGKVLEIYLQMLMSSKTVKGVSPIFHPDYVPVIENRLKQGNTIELIITKEVLDKTLQATKTNLTEFFLAGTLKIRLKENLKIALTVTEQNFSLGLFTPYGNYDDKMDLISLSPQAIQWGEELYEHTLKDSVEFSPQNFAGAGLNDN